MTRKHRKAFHPLQHVLLSLFLEAHPPVTEIVPFGLGPWPCRNPLADHYGQPVAQLVESHREGGKEIGRFACSCGYVFSLAAKPDSKPRILDLGPLFRLQLRRLASEQIGLRAAAKELCVDPGTVRRHAERLGLDVPWAPLKPRPHFQRRPEVTHLHPYQQHPVPRRNWLLIDGQLCPAIRTEAKRLKVLDPPTKISAAVLRRPFGRWNWLASRLTRLPLTARTQDEEAESIEHFRLRRITWAVDALGRRHLPLKLWQVRSLAGLRQQTSPTAKAALKEFTKIHTGSGKNISTRQ